MAILNHAKPSYAKMAAATNSRNHLINLPKGESPSIAAKVKVKVTGARKIWGTMCETTVRSVTGVISKLCKLKPGVQLLRELLMQTCRDIHVMNH